MSASGLLKTLNTTFMSTDYIIILLVSLLVTVILSVVIGNILSKRKYKRKTEEIQEKAKLLTKEAEIMAENLKRDKLLEAKEKILKLKTEFEEEAKYFCLYDF